jgi:hypothetical protein
VENPNPKQFKLEVYGVTFSISNEVPYFINSTLRDGPDAEPEDIEDLQAEAAFNAGCDVVESIILAHVRAGVDVQSREYKEGLETTLEALYNNLT